MNDSKIEKRKGYSFKVKEVNTCPVYHYGDKFELKENLLYTPMGKPACLPLTTHLVINRSVITEGLNNNSLEPFTCEGCGDDYSITLEHYCSKESSEKVEQLVNLLQQFSFFKLLRKDDIRELVPELTTSYRNAGEVIITKGEPGKALFVIVSGKVEVLPDEREESIVVHGEGKVFGEMSLLSGDLCTATVRVLEPVQLLTMKPERFRNMIHSFPRLQKYFFQLLARRLDETNMAKVKRGAEILGNTSEWKLPDLLQTLNMNQKNGILELLQDDGSAEVLFQEGNICRVHYKDLEGVPAFFELFSMHSADFRFHPQPQDHNDPMLQPIGDFMYLMVEGMVRTDEQNIQ